MVVASFLSQFRGLGTDDVRPGGEVANVVPHLCQSRCGGLVGITGSVEVLGRRRLPFLGQRAIAYRAVVADVEAVGSRGCGVVALGAGIGFLGGGGVLYGWREVAFPELGNVLPELLGLVGLLVHLRLQAFGFSSGLLDVVEQILSLS